MNLAEKIATLRKQNGWSQEQLAEKLEVSRQSVSKWESGMSVPDLNKIIGMSKIFGVSTDALLIEEQDALPSWNPENMKSESLEPVALETEKVDGRGAIPISMEEANAFMDLTAQFSNRMAFAVALFVFSPVCLILLAGFSMCGVISLTQNMAGGIGASILLVLIAVGVAILIVSGMQLSKYEYLEKEKISLQHGVQSLVEQKKEQYEASHRKNIALGVGLCIIGAIPLVVSAGFGAGNLVYIICVAILLVMVAFGVYLFVRSGSIYGSYEKLLQEGDYTEEKKIVNKKTSPIAGFYWCLVTAVYLGISFYFGNWERSWIIWPVAGVLFAALYGIMETIIKSKK